MSEVTLKSGKVVNVDVSMLTVKEYRSFTDSTGSVDVENFVITKCTGLSAEAIVSLLYLDSRVLVKAILRDANQPMLDPN